MSGSFYKKLKGRKWWLLVALPIWVYGAFLIVEIIISLLINQLVGLGVPLKSINPVIFNTAISVFVYGISLAVVIGVPIYIKKRRTSLQDLGVNDWPTFLEIFISPLAFVAYFLLTIVTMSIASGVFSVDVQQRQEIPFSQSMLVSHWQLLMAFTVMVVLGPIVEELLYRGYLYGKLRNSFSIWLSVLMTSITFGLAHLWVGPDTPLQWAVAVDTFTLSLVMCAAREYTGAIWVPMMMHMMKNGIAFYFLFINTNAVDQIGALLPFI